MAVKQVEMPPLHSAPSKILIRYCLYMTEYFDSDRIAPLPESLLNKIQGRMEERLWNSLAVDITKSYKKHVRIAALQFILRDDMKEGSLLRKQDREDQHRMKDCIRRALSRKMCVHHFYGRRFIAIWHKWIR